MSLSRNLGIIAWKNLLLRKRQWCMTFFEVIFPILFALLVHYFFKEKINYYGSNYRGDGGQGFVIEEPDLSKINDWCYNASATTKKEDQSFIAYTPNNSETDQLMTRFVLELCETKSVRLEAALSETELEIKYYAEWKANDKFKAAVVFPDGLNAFSSAPEIKYTIRMSADKFVSTNILFPQPYTRDHLRIGPNTNNERAYLDSGFLGLQWHLDKAISLTLTGRTELTHSIAVKPLPYPKFNLARDEFYSGARYAMVNLYMLTAVTTCFLIPSITRNVVGEKQTGIAELLRLTGVPGWLQGIGWIIHVIVPQLITIFCFVLIICVMPFFLDDNKSALIRRGDPSLVLAILFLHTLGSAAIGFLICALFKRPTIATAVGVLLSLASMIAGLEFLTEPQVFGEFGFLFWVFPNFILAQIWINVLRWDYLAVDESDEMYGARWSIFGLDEPAIMKQAGLYENKNYTYGLESWILLLIMVIQPIAYMLLAIYLDGVLPSEHGIRRPLWFFNCERGKRKATVVPMASLPEVPPDTVVDDSMMLNSEASTEATMTNASESNQQGQEVMLFSSFEPEPMGAEVGVDIQNIYKRFDHFKVAVNGVSLRMFTGDIFALLGHNGAGKTTLISMLTGFFSPTSGTAFINGYDIRTNLDSARKSLGLCPQHNMLFDRLTCGEQLVLFGMLRGLKKQQATWEMKMLLARMMIADKENVLASKLSGGQKRKLSLGIALIGGTKVVVLDEPTSGMDPQARREIWDLLLQLRGERTILLTTHFMEEADVLGDRIGIMASGQLQCCGTSTFLKKFYGTGYTLKLTLYGNAMVKSAKSQPMSVDQVEEEKATAIKPTPEAEAILVAVQKHVPNASFKTDARVDHASNEVFLCLPTDTATTSSLSQLFVDLTARKEKLGIKTIGLSQTTMDEVFVKVGEMGHPQQDTSGEEDLLLKAPKGKNPFVGQFLSLLQKMMIYSLRKWVLLTFQIILPLATFVLVMYLSNKSLKPIPIRTKSQSSGYSPYQRSAPVTTAVSEAHQPLPVTLDIYRDAVTFCSGNKAELYRVIGPSKFRVNDVSEEVLRVGETKRKTYKNRFIVGAELLNNTRVEAMFNLYPYHSAPLAINILANFLLNEGTNKNTTIQAINHPFDGVSVDPNSKRSGQSGDYDRSAEEANSVYNSQVRSGNSYTRQGYSKIADNHPRSVIQNFPSLFPLGIFLAIANFVIQPIEEKLSKVKQLQTMTGVSPMVYWGAAFTYDFGVVYCLTIVFIFFYLLFADLLIGYSTFFPNGGWFVFIVLCLMYGFAAILFSYLVSLRASSVTGGYSLVLFLHLFSGLCLGAMPDNLDLGQTVFGLIMMFFYYVFQVFGRCLPSYSFVRGIWYYVQISVVNSYCPLLTNAAVCPEPLPYWIWSKTENIGRDTPRGGNEEVYKSTPGILQEVFYIFFDGIVYLAWLMMVEYKIFRKSKSKLMQASAQYFVPNMSDEDVCMEADRVTMLVASGQTETECLLVKDLSKNYGSFVAVGNLHFGVHYGECFGLLGVNGAGKTTAFRMITGDEIPAKGNAFGFGTTLENDPKKFYSQIGYCPQFDAIIDHFTGKEMLQLFAGLRGVPFKMRGAEALRWLSRMGLSESAHAKCGRYSGGMKRRLSTAMAMIGDPNLILLDEPTSGVDPVSRRQFWSILDKLKQSGQSIILTSHSMEECEALCSRLGIMVNGQFQCFGGVQHLKSKFAQGYSLTVRLKSNLDFGSDEIKAQISDFEVKVQERFQPCELKDKHQNLMQFHLKNPSITWDTLFKSMEEVKTEFASLIEDYSVNETSLEEVFLALARMQYPERKIDDPLCYRICTCSC